MGAPADHPRFERHVRDRAGPEDVPRITDLAEARANPALAVLSAAIHARFVDGHQVSRAAVEARLTVDEATRTRVTACEDADQLEQWFDRAIVASRTDEVFA